MHQALYRKWRPKDFDSVCGQEHITSVLRYEIINNRYSHAYLFCGSRGTGKTTCAKLLAKAVNCLSPENGSPCGKCEACLAIENETTTDVIEMDAASNTGVDYIRDIREAVMYAPSMLKNRVYIIDEVHMLTQSAFNALLKTLEEPPSQVVFILATTEQQKIPATILSRCQKFEFRRISSDVIAQRLLYISEKEGIVTEPEAAKVIAKMAQGGMRDAISLLELCAGDGKEITLKAVRAVTGAMGREQAAEVADAVSKKDTDALFEIVEKVVSSSKEMTVFWQELTDFYRDLLVFKTAKEPAKFIDLTSDEEEMLGDLSARFSPATLLRHCSLLEETYANMLRPGASKRLCAELAFLKMCDEKLDTFPEGLTARVSALEEKIALLSAGAVPIAQTASAPAPKSSASASAKAGETVMYKKSVEAPKTETVKETVKSGQKNVREGLKPVSWWIEAAKKIGEKDPSIEPFMKLAKGYENGSKVLIRAEGSMAVFMLDTPEMRSTLASLATSISGKPHTPDCFEFIEVTVKNDDHPINDLV
ncbi:MAG: DNA polymerase III subunit gamma/tau [Ruminococcaceae bacterium]|nr:DNA polymerase III subunit gamma/tau [Oscillospiraceae bacterium]